MTTALGRVLAAVLLVGGTAVLGAGCGVAADPSAAPDARGAALPPAGASPGAASPGAASPGGASAPGDPSGDPTTLLAQPHPSVGLLQLGHLAPHAPAFDSFFSLIGQDGTLIGTGGYPNLSPYMALPPGRYVWAMRPAGTPPNTPMTLTKLVNIRAGQASTVVLFDNGPQGHLQGTVVDDQLTPPPAGTGLVRVVQGAPGAPIPVAVGGRPATPVGYGDITPYRPQPAGPLTVSSPGAGGPITVQVTPGSATTVLVTRGPDGVRLASTPDRIAPQSPPTGAAPPASVNTGDGGAAATSTWPGPALVAELIAVAALLVVLVAAVTRPHARHRARRAR